MLVIISDLHLWDGTIGVPISNRTFSLFASRLRELAFQASWRSDGQYRPITSLDILLLGDILDPLQSTRWYNESSGYVRPWSDNRSPAFLARLTEITHAILLFDVEIPLDGVVALAAAALALERSSEAKDRLAGALILGPHG